MGGRSSGGWWRPVSVGRQGACVVVVSSSAHLDLDTCRPDEGIGRQDKIVKEVPIDSEASGRRQGHLPLALRRPPGDGQSTEVEVAVAFEEEAPGGVEGVVCDPKVDPCATWPSGAQSTATVAATASGGEMDEGPPLDAHMIVAHVDGWPVARPGVEDDA